MCGVIIYMAHLYASLQYKNMVMQEHKSKLNFSHLLGAQMCFYIWPALGASQLAYLYYALKVCTLFVEKKCTLLSM